MTVTLLMKKLKWLLIFLLFFGFLHHFLECEGLKEMPQCEVLSPHSSIKNFSNIDSVQVIATNAYKGNFLKNILQGSGYRAAWQSPITVPVVHFDTLFGGLIPQEQGGGNQTQSLKFLDSLGNAYTLRSVNKDPVGLIPPIAKTLRIGGIVTDGISAQHPYGALVVPQMADALDLWHTHPRLVFVPEHNALDTFKNKFMDKLYLLEYETDGTGQWTNMEDVIKIGSTKNVQEMELKFSDFEIDTAALVRARLFDLVIGDWDRHAKNWGWIFVKKEEGIRAIPIACDRDNVFYGIGGLIPSIINRPFIQPILRPFNKKIDHLPGMIKPFDSYFLLEVPESVFLTQAAYIQTHLTDAVIEQALSTWPKDFYELDGSKIAEKIKARRDDLPQYAKEFKQILIERGPLTTHLKGSTKLWKKINNE